MKFIRNLSLRTKLMVLVVAISTGILTTYAGLVLRDFEVDKVQYVLDSNRAHARSTASQIRSEINYLKQKAKFYLRGFSLKKGFHSYSKSVIRSDSMLLGMKVFSGGDIVNNKPIEIYRRALTAAAAKELGELTPDLFKEAQESGVSMRALDQSPGYWALSYRFRHSSSSTPLVAILVSDQGSFLEEFRGANIQDVYIANHLNQIVISPTETTYEIKAGELFDLVGSTLENMASPFVVRIHEGRDKDWLLAINSVGEGEIKVVSLMPKDVALEAVKLLFAKSILFVGMLSFLTLFISVFAAYGLTKKLKILMGATQKVSKGELDVEIQVDSEDEVGVLSQSFNHMTSEIRRLLSETAEKARMEAELQTAQTVQSNLFPDQDYNSDTASVQGFYEPASECSGDWWYYSKIGSKIYFWIGDATGHGVPAALVTSAAKSAACVLENFPDIELDQVMTLFNKAIYGTSHGHVMMTFFLGCFNEATGEFTYVNASHDPPFLLSQGENVEPLKRRDIKPLMGAAGARLGEAEDSQYQITRLNLKQGDRLIFYTDGVTELVDIEGKMFGERKLIQAILKTYNADQNDLKQAMEELQERISEFRGEEILHDDCTYFMFQYKKAG